MEGYSVVRLVNLHTTHGPGSLLCHFMAVWQILAIALSQHMQTMVPSYQIVNKVTVY